MLKHSEIPSRFFEVYDSVFCSAICCLYYHHVFNSGYGSEQSVSISFIPC